MARATGSKASTGRRSRSPVTWPPRFKDRDVLSLLDFVPVDHLGWMIVRFGIEIDIGWIRDAESTSADFGQTFAGGDAQFSFKLLLGHRFFLWVTTKKRPPGEGRSWTSIHNHPDVL